MREHIGYNDRNGKPIREGDIVEFTVTYDCKENPTYDSEDGTLMVDTVVENKGQYYFRNNDLGGGSSFPWRHNEYCTITGSIYEVNEED